MVRPNGALSLLGRVVDKFAGLIERHKVLVVISFSALFLAVCALLSATKMLWYDELATYYPAKLPTLTALLDFFSKGLDTATPAASLAARGAMAVFGDGPVVDRMPFTLGCLLLCVCVFFFVQRRCGAVYGAAAMIFPALTSMTYYATELRSYGLWLGLTGIALVCWQAAADGRRRTLSIVGLFLSLAASICCLYYAVFVWIPFGLAELTRTWIRKRIDWPVWLALGLSPGVILVFLPAIRLARATYVGSMLGKPAWGAILNSYVITLESAALPILGATILCLLLSPVLSRPDAGFQSPPLPEWVLAGTLSLLPVFVVPFSMFTGFYFVRYVLPCVAGLAIFFAFAFCWGLKGDRFAPALVVVVFLMWFTVWSKHVLGDQMAANGGLRTPLGQPYRVSDWSLELERSDLPIVTTPGLFFMKLQYYGSERVRPRVYYVADDKLAFRYDGFSTEDQNLSIFHRVLPLQVAGFSDFVSRNHRFLICADSADPTWIVRALLDRGAELRLRIRSGNHFVFEATMP